MSDPNDRPQTDPDEEEALVAFFEALRPAARKTYEALAARDRALGEDVTREAKLS